VLKDQPNTTPPTPTPAEKRWVVDSAAWNEWVVDVPAQPAVAEQGHWVGYWLCGGQKFYDYADLMAYSKQLYAEGKPVPSDSSEKEWVIDVPGKDAVPEQGHWVEHAEVGHWE
jgi:hypothetical protein